MSQISVFAVSRMISQPGLLGQLSRFVSMDSPELVRHTLSDTLPYLFVNRNDRVLDAIGAELGEKVSTLLMEHSSDILARIFLLPNDVETNRTLSFIVKVLNDDTKGNSDIQVKNIVQTCYIPLLAELVIVMGEDGSARVDNVSTNATLAFSGSRSHQEQAIKGIQHVQRIMSPAKKSRNVLQEGSLRAEEQLAREYLTSNMLAVMTRLSEILHEMHGKKSVNSKRQIIRSLGPLISYIGKGVGSIGLQVSPFD